MALARICAGGGRNAHPYREQNRPKADSTKSRKRWRNEPSRRVRSLTREVPCYARAISLIRPIYFPVPFHA
jgi:hypothetical protein